MLSNHVEPFRFTLLVPYRYKIDPTKHYNLDTTKPITLFGGNSPKFFREFISKNSWDPWLLEKQEKNLIILEKFSEF